jgi:hypothetical protein
VEEERSSSLEASSRINVRLYRVFKVFLKTIPMLMTVLYLGNTVLSFFDIDISLFSYLTGVGFIPWLFIMVSSYLFGFCEYHRMFLWYILTNNLICWTDEEFGLPISNWNFLVLHIIVAGIFLFLVLYFHQRCKESNS